MDLHELSPVGRWATGGRDGRSFERFAEMCQWLTSRGRSHPSLPWFTNVARSLRKEPKWFLRDWSLVADAGKRAETFVACHLLKAVEGWTDLGLGEFRLAYLRDKGKREVDFIVIRDGRPWFLVEVKQSDTQLQAALGHFQRQLGAPQAFQVVIDADYVAADCFARAGEPLVVPARTFLSQLL